MSVRVCVSASAPCDLIHLLRPPGPQVVSDDLNTFAYDANVAGSDALENDDDEDDDVGDDDDGDIVIVLAFFHFPFLFFFSSSSAAAASSSSSCSSSSCSSSSCSHCRSDLSLLLLSGSGFDMALVSASRSVSRLGYSLEFADNLSLSVGGFNDKLPDLMKALPGLTS